MLIASLCIWYESPGSVIYKSTRCGKHRKPFTFYKFRTMYTGSEHVKPTLKSEVSGPVFKMKQDPRVTKVGRILRRTSIDELPQLFNVLKGDMSLVGPRPPIPSETDKYTPYQMRRLDVKPGITCLWQVNGRSELPFESQINLDMQYINSWGLLLDLAILARTIPAVLGMKGAY